MKDSKTNFAPVKWKFRLTPNDLDFAGAIESEDGDSIADVYSKRHLPLIAAAPEMYEALKKLLVEFEYQNDFKSCNHIEAYQNALQALAKARGENTNQP